MADGDSFGRLLRSHRKDEKPMARGVAPQQSGDVSGVEYELKVTDQLLESCMETLRLIPPCPTHGFCHPHMQDWIRRMKVHPYGLTPRHDA